MQRLCSHFRERGERRLLLRAANGGRLGPLNDQPRQKKRLRTACSSPAARNAVNLERSPNQGCQRIACCGGERRRAAGGGSSSRSRRRSAYSPLSVAAVHGEAVRGAGGRAAPPQGHGPGHGRRTASDQRRQAVHAQRAGPVALGRQRHLDARHCRGRQAQSQRELLAAIHGPLGRQTRKRTGRVRTSDPTDLCRCQVALRPCSLASSRTFSA